ncbi:MAG: HEAT repeat domain-containing protein [Planctomycetaceae bacterium]|nr:HEAT repeat domain-containing protein [Planctomycetaceae bacterium]
MTRPVQQVPSAPASAEPSSPDQSSDVIRVAAPERSTDDDVKMLPPDDVTWEVPAPDSVATMPSDAQSPAADATGIADSADSADTTVTVTRSATAEADPASTTTTHTPVAESTPVTHPPVSQPDAADPTASGVQRMAAELFDMLESGPQSTEVDELDEVAEAAPGEFGHEATLLVDDVAVDDVVATEDSSADQSHVEEAVDFELRQTEASEARPSTTATQNTRPQPAGAQPGSIAARGPVAQQTPVTAPDRVPAQPMPAPVAPAPIAPAPMPAMPSVVHVPVPVPTAMPAAQAAAADVAAEIRPEIPVKLPEADAVGVPQEQLKANEPEEAKAPAAADAESAETKTQQAALKKARKRLKEYVNEARKDLFRVQEDPKAELPKKISKLLDELSAAKDLKTSQAVLKRLGATRAAAIVSPLQERASSPSVGEPLKLAMIDAVAGVSDAASSQFLLTLLSDPSTAVVEESIRNLVRLQRPESLLPLIAAALVRSSSRSVLTEALTSQDQSVSEQIVDRLKKLLSHDDEDIVVVAIGLLAKVQSEGHFKQFTRLAERDSPEIRAAAMEALVSTGEKQAVRILNKAMKDDAPVVRAAAASGLGQIHSPKSSLLLLSGLNDEEVRVRRSCARSLTLIDDERIPKGVALALKKEDDPTTIEYLLQGLGQTGSPAAFETLERYLNSGDTEMCHRAMATLRKLRDRKSARLILPFLDDSNVDTRRQAVETLGMLGEPKTTDRLRELLKTDKTAEVRAASARALGELGGESSTAILEEALYDDRSVKIQAIIALGRLQAKGSIPAIMAQLRDAGADVRYHACSALGQMEEIPNPERLLEMLDDRDAMVQRGARAALTKLNISYKKGQALSVVRRLASKLVPSALAGGLPVGGMLVAVLVIGVLGYGGYYLATQGLGGAAASQYRVSTVIDSAVSQDGAYLAVYRRFNVFETWDLSTGDLVNRTQLETAVSGLKFVDGKTVLLLDKGDVRSLDVSTTDITPESFQATDLSAVDANTVSVSANGAYAVSCSIRGRAQVVDLKSMATVGSPFTVRGYKRRSALAVTGDASMVLVGKPDGVVMVLSPETGKGLGSLALGDVLKRPGVELSSMALNPDSSVLAVGTRAGEVLMIDLNALKLIGTPFEGGKPVVNLSFRGDECLFFQEDGAVGICDATYQKSSALTAAFPEEPQQVDVSVDGRFAVGTFEDSKEFVVLNLEQDKVQINTEDD